MSYCKLVIVGDLQQCEVCGVSFATTEKVRSVCGVQRTGKKPKGGPGSELKKILARFGIQASPTCKCNARAVLMDYNGIEWCEENIETIVGWLGEEADRRGLPFINAIAAVIVRRAIANAKKNAAINASNDSIAR